MSLSCTVKIAISVCDDDYEGDDDEENEEEEVNDDDDDDDHREDEVEVPGVWETQGVVGTA